MTASLDAQDEIVEAPVSLRPVWLGAGTLVALFCSAVAFAVFCPGKKDHYDFLDGHKPFDTGVLDPGAAGPREVRLYTWEGDVDKTESAADKDLLKLGFNKDGMHSAPHFVTWYKEGITVVLIARHSHSRREALMVPRLDTNWVTVIVIEEIPDTWRNKFRYTFDPVGY